MGQGQSISEAHGPTHSLLTGKALLPVTCVDRVPWGGVRVSLDLTATPAPFSLAVWTVQCTRSFCTADGALNLWTAGAQGAAALGPKTMTGP